MKKIKIVIGTANFNQRYGLKNLRIKSINEIKKILNFLKNNNINYIDTAFSYNLSKLFLSKINFKNFKIITKIKLPSTNVKSFLNNFDKLIMNKLSSFGIKKFEAVLLHDIKDLSSKNSKEFIRKLLMLKKKGIIKNLGVSIYEKKDLDIVLKIFKPDLIQFPASILDQRFLNKSFLKKLINLKIKAQIRSVFLQGILLRDLSKKHLTSKKIKLNKTLKSLEIWCKKNGVSRKEASLLFIKNQKNIDFLTIGIDSIEQLKQNLAILKRNKIIKIKKFAITNKKIIDPRTW